MDQQRLTYLHSAYLKGRLSDQERVEWENILEADREASRIKNLMGNTWHNIQPEERIGPDDEKADMMFQGIVQSPQHRSVKLWARTAIAAAVALVVLGAGLYVYQHRKMDNNQVVVVGSDVVPGKQGATLTLSNGKKIRLGDAGNGQLAQEAGVEITKTADGQVVYTLRHPEGGTTEGPVSGGGRSLPEVEMTKGGVMTGKGVMLRMNTIATANGETYQVRLPDGSKVWLNASSSLNYPASFGGAAQRRVKLTGEGYFEIAKDASHPFVVESKGQLVEVLGTHFNINSYADEPDTKTTLLEGSVKLSLVRLSLHSLPSQPSLPSASLPKGERFEVVLRPGEQATTNRGSNITSKGISIKEVDTEEAVAWKNGMFVFNDESLESIMRKIARWYNVEIIYKDVDEHENFWGSFSRKDSLAVALRKLTKTGRVKFKMDNHTIYVLPANPK